MIGNVILFLKHVEAKFFQESKFKINDFQTLYYELKRLSSDVHRGVAVHQQKVLQQKTGMGIFQMYFSLDIGGWMCVWISWLEAYVKHIGVLWMCSHFFSCLKIKCISSLAIYIVMYLNLWHTVPTEKQLSAVQEQAFMSAARKKIRELFSK